MEIGDLAQSFQSIIGGLQTLTSLTRKAEQQGLSDEFTKELNSAVINMQSAVMDAQSMTLEAQGEQSRLIARVVELEEELKQKVNWEGEKARYELTTWGGNHVYQLREDLKQDSEPTHFLCPTCYENGVKSILQAFNWDNRPHTRCLRCAQDFLAP